MKSGARKVKESAPNAEKTLTDLNRELFMPPVSLTSCVPIEEAGGDAGGSAVLLRRVAALTRNLDERDRMIDTLLQRVKAMQEHNNAAAGYPPNCTVCPKAIELEEKNRQLEEALQRLQRADKLIEMGQLAAGIAHELNTPIQYIADNFLFLDRAFKLLMNATELCKTALESVPPGQANGKAVAAAQKALAENEIDYLRQDMPDALDQSREGLRRIADIVAAMRRFSHPSNDLVVATDLREVIETTAAVARNEWKYAAELHMQFDDRLPEVPCVRDAIARVILNLLINAAHTVADANRVNGRPKGTIAIRTRLCGNAAEVTIADNGLGIPDEIQSRIFEPFFTTKSVGGGTGQGLALARATVVERHKGELFFETETGKGTTFHVRLPLQQPEASA